MDSRGQGGTFVLAVSSLRSGVLLAVLAFVVSSEITQMSMKTAEIPNE